MTIPFSKEQLAAPVPHIPLDDPRLAEPVYLEVSSPRERLRRNYRYVQSPWTLRDCVPSVWINKHVQHIEPVTFIGTDRFGRVGLGMLSSGGSSLDMWTSQLGIWRSSAYHYCSSKVHDQEGNKLHGDFEFYAVDNWFRFDMMSDEEKIVLLKRYIERHNRDICSLRRYLDDSAPGKVIKRYRRNEIEENRRCIARAKTALSSLGCALDLDVINAGISGQLSLF